MGRLLSVVYGVVAYAVFFVTFLYAIGFVGCLVVPKCVNGGPETPLRTALAIDLLLLGAFAIQHSVMARPGFKQWWTKMVPRPVERSTYVMLASLVLILLYWQWRPLPAIVWDVQAGALRGLLWGVFGLGWLIVLLSTFMIDHFDLFGLRQVWLYFHGRDYTRVPFKTTAFYRYSRNPINFGFLLAFWAAPTMTAGRLLFTLATTGYILVATQLEERDHAHFLGDAYRAYKARTSRLIPMPPKRS